MRFSQVKFPRTIYRIVRQDHNRRHELRYISLVVAFPHETRIRGSRTFFQYNSMFNLEIIKRAGKINISPSEWTFQASSR